MTRRRTLRFGALAEVAADVQRLLPSHRTLGRWSLGQICHHLGGSIRWSVLGFPPPHLPRPVQWTAGSMIRWGMLTFEFIPRGMPAPRPFQPPAETDAGREADELCRAIEQFASHRGRFARHPLIGRMSRGQWERFHCIHCAHHLSFVLSGEGEPAS